MIKFYLSKKQHNCFFLLFFLLIQTAGEAQDIVCSERVGRCLETGTNATDFSSTFPVTQKVNVSTGIVALSAKPARLLLYPNPTSGVIELDSLSMQGNSTIEIFNLSGSIISSQKINSFRIDISLLPVSIYEVRLKTADGKVSVGRIVKQ